MLAPDACEKLAARALVAFARRLDESGLHVPGQPQNWNLETINHRVLISEPDLWPFVALAQHHGIPTGLLDWTRVSSYAAYFAAASEPPTEPSRALAVWALSERFVKQASGALWRGPFEPVAERPGIRLVTAPRASNPNLHAQAGVFVVWERAEQPLSLDEAIEVWALRTSDLETLEMPVLYRFEMPQAEAPELRRLLSYYNVDAARLFPGCEGVVRAIREEGVGFF
jgi:hypothetical protein